MPTNIEIKAIVPGLGILRDKLEKICDGPGIESYQDDTFFAVPHGRLKLRTFLSAQAQLIYYHRHDSLFPKPSHYIVSEISDPSSMHALLAESLGVIGCVRKYRTLFMIDNTRVHLDEVEGLGSYVELEVVLTKNQSVREGKQIALDLMNKLDIDLSALVKGAYLDLINSSQKRR
jgi:predicted adenylyl cyclase CyaB